MTFTVTLADDWDADGWTLVPRAIVRDTDLSWKAKGLVAWLASHERGFSMNREYIINAGPDGEDAVKSGLRELREASYLTVERGRDEAGHVTSASYYRLHRNRRSEPDGGKPTSGENLQREKPPGGKSRTKNTTKEEHQEEPAAPGGTEQQPPAENAPTLNQRAVLLAQAHYERLGKMGNVPAFMKIIRKALEHDYPDNVVDRACAWIADHNWTLTEERLANTLKGGPRLPSGPAPRANGRQVARTSGGMEIQS